MRTNKFSIGGLIGVHVSSVVDEDNFKSVYFFYENNFKGEKNTKRKTNDFHPLRSFCACKKMLPLLFSVPLFFFCKLIFACDVFYLRLKFFRKKKISWLEIVLITSYTILLQSTSSTRKKLQQIAVSKFDS